MKIKPIGWNKTRPQNPSRPAGLPLKTLLSLGLAWAWMGSAPGEPELLFRETFEEGDREGVVGMAGSELEIPAAGKVNMERGTFSFFVRFDTEPQSKWYYALAGVDQQLGEGHYFSVMRFEGFRDDFGFSLLDAGRYGPPLKFGPIIDRWEPGQWKHLAVAWDRDEGITLYEDGERIDSNWGQYRWAWNLIPRTIRVGNTGFANPTHRYGGEMGEVSIDEVRIYAEPLTDQQIAALAKGEDPEGPAIPLGDTPERAERERQRMGWSGESLTALPKVRSGKAAAVRFAPRVEAIDLKRPQAQLAEGLSRTTWPRIYYGPAWKGRSLDLQVPASEPGYDRVRMFVQRPFEGSLAGAASETAIPISTETATIWHRQLKDDLQGEAWRLHREQGQLGQIDFYRVEPAGSESASDEWRLGFVEAEAFPESSLGAALKAETARHLQQPLQATSDPVSEWKLETPAFGGFQAFSKPIPEARAWTGARLRLVLDELSEPTPVRITIKEPVHAERDWLVADLILVPDGAGRQQFDIELEGRPVITLPEREVLVPAGRRQHEERVHDGAEAGVLVVAGAPLTWVMGENGTEVIFVETSREEVLVEATDDQIDFLREGFMTLMEAHQFGDPRIQMPLMWLALFAPERKEFQQMVRRGGLRPPLADFQEPEIVTEPEPDNPYDAPGWALWQHRAMERLVDMVDWRLENQQLPSGEFGATWNDDSIMIEEEWVAYALSIDDDHGTIRRALRRFWDGMWSYGLDRGVSRYTGSAGHFSEEGMNSVGLRLLVDYGDPVAVDRAMQATALMENWYQETDEGMELRSTWIGPDGVWFDQPGGSGLNDLLGPAGHLLWYNNHPEVERFFEQIFAAAEIDWRNEPPTQFAGFAAASMLPLAQLSELAENALTEGAEPARRGDDLTGWLAFTETTPEIVEARAADDFQPGDPLRGYPSLGDTESQVRQFRLTGDERWLEDAARRLCEWFNHYDWIIMKAFPAHDRIAISHGAVTMARMGARAGGRGSAGFLLWPFYAISYEKGGRDVAGLVTENLPDLLEARFFAFTNEDHELDLRVWRLLPGRYQVVLRPFDPGDEKMEPYFDEELHLVRGSPLNLELPPHQEVLLTIKPVELDEVDRHRPDLAVSLDTVDIVYNRHLVVKVHNLGSAPAENVLVRIRDASTGAVVPMGEQRIDLIKAPVDFRPRFGTVQIDNIYSMAQGVIIEVDPDGEIDDLNPFNNRLVLTDGHIFGPRAIGAERAARRAVAEEVEWTDLDLVEPPKQ